MIPKPFKIRSKAITQSARDETCTLRISGVCNGNPTTTVFAHLPGHKGIGTKGHDLFGVYACSNCHDWLDGRYREDLPFVRYSEQDIMRALQETQLRLYERGIITVK